MSEVYRSEVLRVGEGAQEMVDGGVLILFAAPVPEALEEVSVVHRPEGEPARALRAGDTFRIGGSVLRLTDVGGRADENLRTLGHLVVYVDTGEDLLPGAVRATGSLALPKAGDAFVID